MKKRNELIIELFELHKLLAEKGEVHIGYNFSKRYNILEAKVKKLTIPVNSSKFDCLNECDKNEEMGSCIKCVGK